MTLINKREMGSITQIVSYSTNDYKIDMEFYTSLGDKYIGRIRRKNEKFFDCIVSESHKTKETIINKSETFGVLVTYLQSIPSFNQLRSYRFSPVDHLKNLKVSRVRK